jgi:hypothetical protein
MKLSTLLINIYQFRGCLIQDIICPFRDLSLLTVVTVMLLGGRRNGLGLFVGQRTLRFCI